MALLEVRNLGKRFGKGPSLFYALRHINISFPEKGFFAIKGKSGSGKSTLLNLMAKFLEPDEGGVYFQGRKLSSLDQASLAHFHLQESATIFQHYNLVEGGTPLENVCLPQLMAGKSKKESEKKAKELLVSFGLGDSLEKNIDVLSGGEKQRVAIARALANDPKVVFADEPTGALDEENSHLVMASLKEIAKDRLVIIVSHNDSLIEQYCEQIIEIKDGKLIKGLEKSPRGKKGERPKQVKRRDRAWWTFFTRRNLVRNLNINVISFIAGFVGFLSLLLCAGFYNGSQESLEHEQCRSLEYLTASISEKTYLESENSPLSLVRLNRPEMYRINEALSENDEVVVANDYGYFLSSYRSYSLDGQAMEPTTFLPSYDLSSSFASSLLKSGELPEYADFGSVLVNEEFAALHKGSLIGRTISFSQDFSLDYNGVSEKGTLHYSFKVAGIISEFAFLNSPKVYYSYTGLTDFLAGYELKELSASLLQTYSLSSILDLLPNDHAATSSDYLLFAKSKQAADSLFLVKEDLEDKGSTLSIDSSAYEVKTAYSSLIDAFSLCLLLFVGISIVGVALIVAMVAYSSFSKRRKETAILLVLGAKGSELRNVYTSESVLLSSLYAGVALAVGPLAQLGLNLLIEHSFGLVNLIQIPYQSFFDIPFIIPIGLLLFAVAIAFLASSLPLGAIRRMPLADILHDE